MKLLDMSNEPSFWKKNLSTMWTLVLELTIMDSGNVKLKVTVIVKFFPTDMTLRLFFSMYTDMLVEVWFGAEVFAAVRAGQAVTDIEPILLSYNPDRRSIR